MSQVSQASMIHYSCESVRSVLFKVEIEEAKGSSATRSPCLSLPQAVRRTAGAWVRVEFAYHTRLKLETLTIPCNSVHHGHQILGAAIRALARLRSLDLEPKKREQTSSLSSGRSPLVLAAGNDTHQPEISQIRIRRHRT